MLELDRFIADCRAAVSADASQAAVREVVARAVCEPGAIFSALGEPKHVCPVCVGPLPFPSESQQRLKPP